MCVCSCARGREVKAPHRCRYTTSRKVKNRCRRVCARYRFVLLHPTDKKCIVILIVRVRNPAGDRCTVKIHGLPKLTFANHSGHTKGDAKRNRAFLFLYCTCVTHTFACDHKLSRLLLSPGAAAVRSFSDNRFADATRFLQVSSRGLIGLVDNVANV